MSQDHLTLHELLPPDELAAALEAGHVTRKSHPELPLSICTYTPQAASDTRKLTAAWHHLKSTHIGAPGSSTPICPTRFATCAAATPTLHSCSRSAGGQKSPSPLGRKPSSTSGRRWGGLASRVDHASRNGSHAFGQSLSPAYGTTPARTTSAAARFPAEGSASITGTRTCSSRASSRAAWPHLAPATSTRKATGGSPRRAIPTPIGMAGSSNTARSWPTSSAALSGQEKAPTTRTATGSTTGPKTLSSGSGPSRRANAQVISSRGRQRSLSCTEQKSIAASSEDIEDINGGCRAAL